MEQQTVKINKQVSTTATFPEGIKFKYKWRKYQKRVLEELENHLDDNHLHIIAPPGSGKTILGLEVAIRLNKPTLIFAPTIAIRNQWIQRFCELFIQSDCEPDWISRDINNPKFLTVSTYQGLHAACTRSNTSSNDIEDDNIDIDCVRPNNNKNTETLITKLKAQNFGTIVVDEAHHLKNAWWQSLSKVKKALDPTIVGLTATPPYDVTYFEWQRYIDLNGPVDAEISVPELIIEGDLCPHQDYVYLSMPTKVERKNLSNYRKKIETLFKDLKSDKTLIEALELHPIITSSIGNLDWIYSNLEYYTSVLVFLNDTSSVIAEYHKEVIGDKNFDIPKLNYEWMEVLLTFYLYKDPEGFSKYTLHQEQLINKLKRNGAMERRTVNFRNNRKINSFLSSSISKLNSIDKIVDFEHNVLKENLRMVILTDFIRKEYLIEESENNLQLSKIGVLPIFEKLRRTNDRNMKIGVLTGSIIIIPETALEPLTKIAQENNIDSISASKVAFDDKYLIINANEKLKHKIVYLITELFQKGQIEVLIGTKSLLGEGWDAPAINSLILASFVGSYVLSNQMRGRAIRTQQKNIDKTGNIWHLVCVDPSTPDGGEDIQVLKRRFKAFVGVSNREELSIENGIERLAIPEDLSNENTIKLSNDKMLSLAGSRNQLKSKWHKTLEGGSILIEEMKIPFPRNQNYKSVKSLYYNKTIKNLLLTLGASIVTFLNEILQAISRFKKIENFKEFMYLIIVIGVLGLLFFGRRAFKALRVYIKYRDISKDIQQIGETLLETLIRIAVIKREDSNYNNLYVVSEVDDKGAIYCHLEGGTTFEKSIFIKSIQEIIGTVKTPRYIITRNSFFKDVIAQKDFHSVPEIIGKKKVFATIFYRQWNQFVGQSELIYTRTIEGRKLLLKSRIHSLASEFEEKTERINKWR